MPGVGLHTRWSRVVTRNCKNCRVQVHQLTKLLIDSLDHGHLAFKIPIFAAAVGGLDVNEGKIEIIPPGSEGSKFVFRAFSLEILDLHADQAGNAFVHWIHGYASWIQAIARAKLRQLMICREASESESISL